MDVYGTDDAANLNSGGSARILANGLQGAVAVMILSAALQVVAERGAAQVGLS
jgi:hypothetical protein